MIDNEWYKLSHNPQAITQLYTQPPSLSGVQLFEISFNDNGDLYIRADLTQFPEYPPQRWTLEGCNGLPPV